MAAADTAFTVGDLGNVLLYVAPGLFARIGYTAKFPQPDRQEFYSTVVSIAASVPIVAVGATIARQWKWPEQATDVRYVALLLGLGILAGYLVAFVRGSRPGRSGLHELGLPFAPEATVYEQTVMKLPIDADVTVTFKDGRVVSGYPTIGPALVQEGQARELYLSRPRWWSGTDWQASGEGLEGLIISLDEVVTVGLPVDPAETHPRLVLPVLVRAWRTVCGWTGKLRACVSRTAKRTARSR